MKDSSRQLSKPEAAKKRKSSRKSQKEKLKEEFDRVRNSINGNDSLLKLIENLEERLELLEDR